MLWTCADAKCPENQKSRIRNFFGGGGGGGLRRGIRVIWRETRVGDTHSQPEDMLSSCCFLAVFDPWSSATKLLIKITGVCRDYGIKVSSLIVFISLVLQLCECGSSCLTIVTLRHRWMQYRLQIPDEISRNKGLWKFKWLRESHDYISLWVRMMSLLHSAGQFSGSTIPNNNSCYSC